MAYHHPSRSAVKPDPAPKTAIQAWAAKVEAALAASGRYEGSYKEAVAVFRGWKDGFGLAFEGDPEDQPARWAEARGLVVELWWQHDRLVYYRREWKSAAPQAVQPTLF